jgi:hypothetical protein
MRRLIATVALIVTLWPQIALMRCAGPAPSPGSHASSMMPDHEHGRPECPAVMSCAAPMIESVRISAPVAAPGLTRRLVAPRPLPPTVAVLTDEPPPPRRGA